MRYSRLRFYFLSLCVLFAVSAAQTTLVITAKASETDMPVTGSLDEGLLTEPFSDEEKSHILENVKFIRITSYSPIAVVSFDVCREHRIVIGAEQNGYAIIAVFDNLGNFQYGFKIRESGSFRVMWSDEYIAYQRVRGSTLYKIDQDGNILDVRKVIPSADNSVYEMEVLDAHTRTVDECTYRLTNGSSFRDNFSSSFKYITKTDGQGTTTIYDASGDRQSNVVWLVLTVFVMLLLCVGTMIVFIKEHRKRVA